MGCPPSVGLESFILFGSVRSPAPCVARVAQMASKAVGWEGELGRGVVSEGSVSNEESNLGKRNHKKSGKTLDRKSIQLKQRVFV